MSGVNRLPDPETVFASSYRVSDIVVEPYGELTTTEEVRAVFGLSEAELPDEMLTQRIYAREVAAALNSLDQTLRDTFQTRLQGKPELRELVNDFALYCIAAKLCEILPVIVARSMTDSKAMFQRFDNDLNEVARAIKDRYARTAQALQKALAETPTAAKPVRSLFASGRPKTDRVTGDSR